jgi:hypothetical protein
LVLKEEKEGGKIFIFFLFKRKKWEKELRRAQ